MLDFDLAQPYEVETRSLKQAVKRNITRTFVKLRKIASSNEELSRKIKDLGKTVKGNCSDIQLIFNTINRMLNPRTKKKSKIGFKPEGRT